MRFLLVAASTMLMTGAAPAACAPHADPCLIGGERTAETGRPAPAGDLSGEPDGNARPPADRRFPHRSREGSAARAPRSYKDDPYAGSFGNSRSAPLPPYERVYGRAWNRRADGAR